MVAQDVFKLRIVDLLTHSIMRFVLIISSSPFRLPLVLSRCYEKCIESRRAALESAFDQQLCLFLMRSLAAKLSVDHQNTLLELLDKAAETSEELGRELYRKCMEAVRVVKEHDANASNPLI